MTDLMYGIGDALQWLFQYTLEPLGNLPNMLFLLIGFVAVGYWIYLQKKYTKKAKDEGGLV